MFADSADARTEAESKPITLFRDELGVLEVRSTDRLACAHALEAVKPTCVPIEVAAKEYAEAWKARGGRAGLLDAARECAPCNLKTYQ